MYIKLFTILSLLVSGLSVSVQQPGNPGEILVRMNSDHSIQQLLTDHGKSNFSKSKPSFKLNRIVYDPYHIYLLDYDPVLYQAQEIKDYLNAHPDVISIQLNRKASSRGTTPNDPFYEEQWHLDKVDLPDLWDITTGGITATGDTIVVAILDGGCNPAHEDIQPNHWVNRAEIPNDGIDNDNNGYIDDYNGLNIKTKRDNIPDSNHGCEVAGIIGARGDNDAGVTGVNWQVKLMQVSGTEYPDEIVEAYLYVLDMKKRYLESNGTDGAFVVATNFSLGTDTTFCEEESLWGEVYDSLGYYGVVSVGATSNKYDVNVDLRGDLPTSCPSDYLISVTNTDQFDRRVNGAAFGKINIDLAAPGVGLYTTRRNGRYRTTGAGTSYSTPMVAGVVALLYSIPQPDLMELANSDPKAAASMVRRAILDGVTPASDLEGITVTGGRLNAFGSLLALLENFGTKSGQLSIELIRPNPVAKNNYLEVCVRRPKLKQYDIKVYNSLGQLLLTEQIEEDVTDPFKRIYIPEWSAGIYYLTVENAQNITSSSFVVY